MTIEQINMALALYKEKNFSNAAESCFVSQSTFSKAIQALENEIGTTLFTRKKRGTVPTEAGKTFLQYAAKMNSDYETMMDALHRNFEPTGTLSVAVMGISPEYRLMKLLHKFELNHPYIKLSIQPLDMIRMKDNSMPEFDVIIAWKEVIPNGWETCPLADEYLLLLVPDHHPLARSTEPVSLAQVKDELFCLAAPVQLTNIHLDICKAAGFTPKILHYVTHPLTMLQIVSEEMSNGLMFEKAFNYYQHDGVCGLKLKEKYTSQLLAAFSNTQNESQSLLFEYLKEHTVDSTFYSPGNR